MAKNPRRTSDPVVKELDSIKRLLILLLLKAGAQQSELALALQMDQAAVSRMLPARRVKRFVSRAEGDS